MSTNQQINVSHSSEVKISNKSQSKTNGISFMVKRNRESIVVSLLVSLLSSIIANLLLGAIAVH